MRNRQNIVFMILLGVATAAFLGGCCTLGLKNCTVSDTITLVSSGQLNACSSDNKSHPVVVRFFPLKETEKFVTGSFEEIWDDPLAVLGGDLVGGYQEVFLAPGTRVPTAMIRPAEVTAVGMLVNFCAEKDINSRRHLFQLGDKALDKTVRLSGLNFSVE